MIIKFYPDCSSNPYLELLSKFLRKYDVHIIKSSYSGRFPILKNIKENKYIEVIHFHWMKNLLNYTNIISFLKRSIYMIIEIIIIKGMDVKLVWTIHNLTSHNSKYRNLQIRLYHLFCLFFDEIFVHCERARIEIREKYKLNLKVLKKISVIKHPSYIDYYSNSVSKKDARERLNIGNKKFVFLFIGKIREYKGVKELIQVFKKLDVKEKYLLIAGEPESEDLDISIKNEIGKSCNIQYINKEIPDNTIQIYMNAADVVVLPYKQVLTSGSAVLAMSFKKPIVAPSIGCLKELINSKGGILYDNEEGNLEKALRKISGKDIKCMGDYNYEKIKKERWENMAKETAIIYGR